MIVEETVQYKRTKKKLLKKHILSEDEIEKTLSIFEIDSSEPSLHYKKMTCKKDKNRYSIRVLNTAYRILMSVEDDCAYLVCICDHDDYDYRNKNCSQSVFAELLNVSLSSVRQWEQNLRRPRGATMVLLELLEKKLKLLDYRMGLASCWRKHLISLVSSKLFLPRYIRIKP